MEHLEILMVADSFWPVIGGSEIFNLELSRQLVRRGHTVYVLTERRDEDWLPEEVFEGIRIIRFDVNCSNVVIHIPSSFLNVRKAFASLANQVKFDVLTFHPNLAPVGVNWEAGNRYPKVTLFYAPWCHEYQTEVDYDELPTITPKKSWHWTKSALMERFQRGYLQDSARIVVWSRYSDTLLRKFIHSNHHGKIAALTAGVDLDKFHPALDKAAIRQKLKLPQDKFILFTARRLVARMGLENLIEAVAKLCRRFDDILLLIAGDGPLRNSLEQLAGELEVNEYVTFLGMLDHDTILPIYYQASDLFVLPTKSLEGFGLITAEALASGVPVLGTPVGATKDILQQLDSSLLFNGMEAEDIANSIFYFMQNRRNDMALRKKCREYALQNYSWEKSAEKLEQIYWSIIRRV